MVLFSVPAARGPIAVSWPTRAELPNNVRARKKENETFLDSEIADLLASGAVSNKRSNPSALTLFGFKRAAKKKRLVMVVSRRQE